MRNRWLIILGVVVAGIAIVALWRQNAPTKVPPEVAIADSVVAEAVAKASNT